MPQLSKKQKYVIYSLTGVITLALIGLGSYFFIFSANPKLLMVSGTEYISGEQGQIIVKLQDSSGNPINDANCNVSLLYPDKTFFIVEQHMIRTAVPGNYYFSFTTPSNEGIYEENIQCIVSGKLILVSSSFHVSTGLNLVAKIFEKQQEQYQKIIEDFIITQELLQNNLGNLSQRLDSLELKLNTSMEENQNAMSSKISKMGIAIQEIFSDNSS